MNQLFTLSQLSCSIFFASEGAKIIHHLVMAEDGRHNIMFGEDFNQEYGDPDRGGFISALVQKPKS